MCWLREKRNFCLWTVHTLMVLSSEAVTRVCPSPEKLTLRTEAVWALKNVDSAFLYTYTNTKTTHKIKTNCKNLWVLKCVSSSVLAGAQRTQCNCLVVLFFFFISVSIIFLCPSFQEEYNNTRNDKNVKGVLQNKGVTHMLGTHRRTVLSLEAEATRWPEGENWTERTASLCPLKRYARIWGFMFQIITQESIEPVAETGESTGERTEHIVYDHRKLTTQRIQ